MLEILQWFVLVVLTPIEANDTAKVQKYYATIFATKDDPFLGGKSPCLNRRPLPEDDIIAHRFLACGTKVRITSVRTGRFTYTSVGERGPYGACTYPGWVPGNPNNLTRPNPCPKGYWVIKRKASEPGLWRGAADITPAVAKRIGHTGYELILLEVVPKKPRPQPAPKPNT